MATEKHTITRTRKLQEEAAELFGHVGHFDLSIHQNGSRQTFKVIWGGLPVRDVFKSRKAVHLWVAEKIEMKKAALAETASSTAEISELPVHIEHVWNTGHVHQENGQWIAARILNGNRVVFINVSQGICGVIEGEEKISNLRRGMMQESVLQSFVTGCYDRLKYRAPTDMIEYDAIREIGKLVPTNA